MELIVLHFATPLLLAFLAAWVLAARPGDAVNRVMAATLALLAAATASFLVYRVADTPDEVRRWIRLVFWFETPALFLQVLLAVLLFMRRPAGWGRRLAVAAVGAGAVVMLIALVAWPSLFTAAIVPDAAGTAREGAPRFFHHSGPLGEAFGAIGYATWSLGVLLAACAARAPERSATQRRQAALVGLGFALLLAHTAAVAVVSVVSRPAGAAPYDAAGLIKTAAALAGAPALVFAVPRLAGAFEGAGRIGVVAAACAAFAAGVYDAALPALAAVGAAVPAGYRSSRPLWLASFAALWAMAIVRYGVAGFVVDARRRVAAVTGYAAVAGVALAGSTYSLGSLGLTPPGAALAAVAALAPVSLVALRPARAASRRLAARLVVDPGSERAEAERRAIYTSALRDARAARWRTDRAEARRLSRLRGELGVPEEDHERILERLAASPDGRAPEILLGRFVVERELGRGGSSTALLAWDSVIGRSVVVKRLRAKGGADAVLVDEMRALARVTHPRVLVLYHAEVVGHELHLVLEYAPGGSLADVLAVRGALPLEEAMAVASDVLEGLAAVHAAGLVHGDVKPGNVLVGADGRAKLADFGAARAQGRDGAKAGPGGDSATLSAMAPEQVRGERATPASDVYAAGALVYRLLTGEHYLDFGGAGSLAAYHRIMRGAPRLPHPRVPAPIADVLGRALAKDPAERPRDAAELRAALARAASVGGVRLEHEA